MALAKPSTAEQTQAQRSMVTYSPGYKLGIFISQRRGDVVDTNRSVIAFRQEGVGMKLKDMQGVGLLVLCVAACSGQGEQGNVDEPQLGVKTDALTSVSVWKSNWSGASATAYASTETSYLSLGAWEDKSKGTRHAYLQYSGYRYDPNSYICQTEEYCKGDPGGIGAGGAGGEDCQEYTWCGYTSYSYVYGWGEIPESAFDVKANAKGARLKLDLAQAPGFFQTTCSYDTVSYQYTCNNSAGGTLDLAWKDDGIYASSSSGVSSQNYGAYSTRSTGQSDQRSATVVGSALDMPVQASGSLATSRGNSVSKETFKN